MCTNTSYWLERNGFLYKNISIGSDYLLKCTIFRNLFLLFFCEILLLLGLELLEEVPDLDIILVPISGQEMKLSAYTYII